MNTPPDEILGNELIREFADRCLSASRSIQGYMSSQNPVPDNDTMESLIDTNEQLQTALNQHQRAMLNARKQERPEPEEQPVPQMNGALLTHNQRMNTSLPRVDSALSYTSTGGGLLPAAAPPPPQAQQPPMPTGSGTASAGGSGTATPINGGPIMGGNGKGKATETSYAPPPGPPPGHAAALASSSGSGSGTTTQRPNQDEVWDDPFADPHDAPGAGGVSSSTGAAYQEQRHAEEPYHPGFGGGQQRRLDPDDDDLYDSPKAKEPANRY